MARDRAGRFLPGESANPAKVFAPGNPHRFQPGESGNPAGKPRSRVQFEAALVDAITNEGTPEEAAKLLWEASRRGEAWAVQNLLVRFWPTTQTLRLETNNADKYDYTRLTDDELDQLEKLLEAAARTDEPQSGADAPEPPEVHRGVLDDSSSV